MSIGYICNVPTALGTVGNNKYVFDRMATPLWAIKDLLGNDFSDFMLKDNLEHKQLFQDSDEKYWVDTKYYVRLSVNGDISDERHAKMYQRMMEAKERFMGNLNDDNKSVLLIRSEEPSSYPDKGERILTNQEKLRYSKRELTHLQEISSLLKSKYPKLNFKILFLSSEGEFVDNTNRIVGIPNVPPCYPDPRCGKKIALHFAKYNDFLQENL